MMEELTEPQKKAIEHLNAYNVPIQWFVGAELDNGDREFLAMGDGFVWSLLVEADGQTHTSEAKLGDWETGINV